MWIAGVDGCKAGWVAVFGDGESRFEARVFSAFGAILAHETQPAIIAVDMPIGLPERIEGGGRGPERALRPLLGARQSSVFAVPSRGAVFARHYAEACAIAASTSEPSRRVSRQAFNLFPKIREIDVLLRDNPEAAARVFECHPEGAFRMMKGSALDEPKKLPSGLRERRALLEAAGFSAAFLDTPLVLKDCGRDDLLDACAAAWTAVRIARGTARVFPETPGRDAHGLRIAIFA